MKNFWKPSTVFAYMQKNKTTKLPSGTYCTENILWSELINNQTELPSLLVVENLFGVANRLQTLRDTIFNSKPIIITSAWRSESYNKKIGGAPSSKHITGEAIDFYIKGIHPSKVNEMLVNFSGGLASASNFTHIDISTKRRWKY